MTIETERLFLREMKEGICNFKRTMADFKEIINNKQI